MPRSVLSKTKYAPLEVDAELDAGQSISHHQRNVIVVVACFVQLALSAILVGLYGSGYLSVSSYFANAFPDDATVQTSFFISFSSHISNFTTVETELKSDIAGSIAEDVGASSSILLSQLQVSINGDTGNAARRLLLEVSYPVAVTILPLPQSNSLYHGFVSLVTSVLSYQILHSQITTPSSGAYIVPQNVSIVVVTTSSSSSSYSGESASIPSVFSSSSSSSSVPPQQVFSFATSTISNQPTFFLIIGQSNAQGFGWPYNSTLDNTTSLAYQYVIGDSESSPSAAPFAGQIIPFNGSLLDGGGPGSIGFGNSFVNAFTAATNLSTYVITAARGSTSLHSGQWSVGGPLYTRTVAAVNSMLSLRPGLKFGGILCSLGESDSQGGASPDLYLTLLSQVVSGLRSAITNATILVPFILLSMTPTYVFDLLTSGTAVQIDAVQRNISYLISTSAFVQGAGAINDTMTYTGADYTHYNADAQRVNGVWMFNALVAASATIRPDPVTELRSTNSSTTVSLFWRLSPLAVTYFVTASIAEITFSSRVTPLVTTQFIGLTTGSTYTFQVIAVNAIGNSSAAAIVASPTAENTTLPTPVVRFLSSANVSLSGSNVIGWADAYGNGLTVTGVPIIVQANSLTFVQTNRNCYFYLAQTRINTSFTLFMLFRLDDSGGGNMIYAYGPGPVLLFKQASVPGLTVQSSSTTYGTVPMAPGHFYCVFYSYDSSALTRILYVNTLVSETHQSWSIDHSLLRAPPYMYFNVLEGQFMHNAGALLSYLEIGLFPVALTEAQVIAETQRLSAFYNITFV